MANPVHASVNSAHFSGGRPQSGNFDDYTLETISSRGGRVTKPSSPRTSASVVRTDRRRRDNRSQTPRGRQTPSSQLAHYEGSTGFLLSDDQTYSPSNGSPQMGLKRIHSGPVVLPNSNERLDASGHVNSGFLPLLPADKRISSMSHGFSMPSQLNEGQPMGEVKYDMEKQLKTNPITHEHLVPEVRGIYRGLAMVEESCIKLDKQQSESKEDLSPAKWQALISIHSTLLHEHHDFFLSSQHPVAQKELTELAEKYSMPARMWRYGIHSLLELLRHKLPGSVEYMLHFIYIAYSMVTLLFENIPSFRETWIECLGDLARYRMAIEETDMRDREVWATVSQYWYNQEADLSPDVGRVQHHLAVLARPDALAQLFYYTKALLCRRPFHNARESIALLFSSIRDQQSEQQDSMPAALIATHDVLFHNQQTGTEQFNTLANKYLSLLQREIPSFDKHGQGGAFVMSSNFAAIFQYGTPEQDIALEFPPRKSQATIAETSQATATEKYEFALRWFAPAASSSDANSPERIDDPLEITSKLSSLAAFNGSALTFHSLAVFLDRSQLGDEKAHAGIHTGLSFIWSIAIHPLAMEKLEPMIPWLKITRFLNSLLSFETDFAKIEGTVHPRFSKEDEIIRARNTRIRIEREKQKRDGEMSLERAGEEQDEASQPEIPDHLPEDFLIRGQVWSELYYPQGFFEGGPVEHDRSFVEPDLLEIVRQHRCLWLGVRLSTFRRWITYDRFRSSDIGMFQATPRAEKYAPFAEHCGGLESKPQLAQRETRQLQAFQEIDNNYDEDFDMGGA